MKKKILIVYPHRDPQILEEDNFTYADFKDLLQDELCFETVGNFDLVCRDNGGENNVLLTDEKMITGPFIVARFNNDNGECLGVNNTDIPILSASIVNAKQKEIPLTFYETTWTI